MRHPYIRNRFQRWIGMLNWLKIFLIFFIITLFCAIFIIVINSLLNVLYGQAMPNMLMLGRESYQTFLSILGACEIPSGFHWITQILYVIAKIGLSVILLGAAVYKISIPINVHVLRKKLSISQNAKGDYFLYFRSYNASGLPAVNLKFDICLRNSIFTKGNHSIQNIIVKATPPSDMPPVMLPWVPHSVVIPLNKDDIEGTGDKRRLISIQGHVFSKMDNDLQKDPGDSYLLIVIRGSLPQLGPQYTELASYCLCGEDKKYEFGDFTHIDVLPPKGRLELHEGRPKKWRGWDEFDEVIR